MWRSPKPLALVSPRAGTSWRVSKEKFLELDADKRIWWGKDGSNGPALKRFLNETKDGRVPQTLWSFEEVGHTQDAKKEVTEFNSIAIFSTPKPEFLLKRVMEIATKPMAANPGFVPAIRVEAPSSGEKEFSWRLFYQRILNALEGELDVQRTAYGVDSETGRVVRPMGPQTHRLAGLRTAVERSLRQRGTRFIVVDEAAHMMRLCHAHRLEMQLDTLKSLSNECGVQWILLGSYDLFELLSLSGQLARRTHVLHLARYRQDSETDVRAFRTCLKKFGEWLPALKEIDLLAYSELFQENTLGCIGTLRAVLERLDRLVAARGWSEETLRTALLTEAQVTQIMREVVEGEERIAPGLSRSISVASHATQRRIA